MTTTRLLALMATLLATTPVFAQQLPAQVAWRYDEDWSVLKNLDPAGLPPWTAGKYVELTPGGKVWLTTGLEIRARYEGYHGNGWGSAPAPNDGYLWLRALPYAALRAGPLKVFVQGIAGYVTGLATQPGPADKTGIDVLQRFGEVSLKLADTAIEVRDGRELVALGSERLVGLRYGPNIPQPFQGMHANIQTGSVRLQLLSVRPVTIGPNDFDDRSSATRRLDAVYATISFDQSGTDIYALDYRNRSEQVEQGIGKEHRETYGARYFGNAGRWGWNWEAMLQTGHFSGMPVHAWSLGTETSYRISPVTIRLRADTISGDHDAGDHTLQTFDPMFPKGKYFGELTPIGPSNIVNLHPGVDLDLRRDLTMGLAVIDYWRQSRGDGIYGIAGNLLRSGSANHARHIGVQEELVLNWHPHPLVSVLASYSVFEPGAFIEQTGPAHIIHMIGLETMFRL
ncbi:alginate export protein [Luteibacter sp. OK325]|uniref:alginate export family protein n=1 Tax=Luteibacter sp. OK325 TaxID=2135670 RepID=UPI000D381E31|nr:alginate export family protein [Luteibacter sp. OK325]PTR34077.1 alginate export protein [Luteibacter sp. OK325]